MCAVPRSAVFWSNSTLIIVPAFFWFFFRLWVLFLEHLQLSESIVSSLSKTSLVWLLHSFSFIVIFWPTCTKLWPSDIEDIISIITFLVCIILINSGTVGCRCRQWLRNCGRYDLLHIPAYHLHVNRRLCSRHFPHSMYKRFKKLERLSRDAVPTIFNGVQLNNN